ncbi:MAG: putative phage tail protein [Fusobacteriaceae bacterium]
MSIFDITKVARNEFITDVVDSIQKVIGESKVEVEDITSCLIVTASPETCDKWEYWLELDSEPTWATQDRIDRIVYTINSKGFFTKKVLMEQAEIFTNGQIEVTEYFEDWHFKVKFVSTLGIPPNVDNFRKMVELNKPAHLTWELEFTYRIWEELRPFNWNDLPNFTWEQLVTDMDLFEDKRKWRDINNYIWEQLEEFTWEQIFNDNDIFNRRK